MPITSEKVTKNPITTIQRIGLELLLSLPVDGLEGTSIHYTVNELTTFCVYFLRLS